MCDSLQPPHYLFQEQPMMMKPFRPPSAFARQLIVALFAWCVVHGAALGQAVPSPAPAPRGDSSYSPVNMDGNLLQIVEKMKAEKPEIEHRQQQLLEQRYDLRNRP